ncbi:hypothetical protein SAMN05216490_3650 [Mucilaginibacter mallensis]|uniref:Cytochrome C n=1 Tax=Mucilaginibacter mallensis TaxID=652787 RepID=A0A1H2AQ29_MUCMA|nr:hypothetical protein [Mucilaginibacter mallensis]SDT48011.1 hypothetical protein SAMN05216490_3650 [Mucilaginibacter mallensis]
MKQYPSFSKGLNGCYIILMLMAFGCNSNNAGLQAQVDNLSHQTQKSYKPGLGEFMLGIQVHHAKLWFAGKNQNWKLATFELGEIQESVDDIKLYCTDRPEIKSLPMLYPALDSLTQAVKLKSLKQFQTAFIGLTKTCNSCHETTHHEFNVIKIPDTPPFSNQDFKAK